MMGTVVSEVQVVCHCWELASNSVDQLDDRSNPVAFTQLAHSKGRERQTFGNLTVSMTNLLCVTQVIR